MPPPPPAATATLQYGLATLAHRMPCRYEAHLCCLYLCCLPQGATTTQAPRRTAAPCRCSMWRPSCPAATAACRRGACAPAPACRPAGPTPAALCCLACWPAAPASRRCWLRALAWAAAARNTQAQDERRSALLAAGSTSGPLCGPCRWACPAPSAWAAAARGERRVVEARQGGGRQRVRAWPRRCNASHDCGLPMALHCASAGLR